MINSEPKFIELEGKLINVSFINCVELSDYIIPRGGFLEAPVVKNSIFTLKNGEVLTAEEEKYLAFKEMITWI